MKKYESIFADLGHKIKSGTLRASERLRSQSELAREYGVSVGTVQKSLRRLEAGGLVVSVHGSGTYVTTGSPKSEELVNWRFLDENNRTLPVFVKVEEVRLLSEDGPWRAHLDAEEVIAVRRIASIDLQFTAISMVYLSRARFDFLLSMPLYQLDGHELTQLIGRHNMESDHFVYHIRGDELSERLCTLNHLDVRSRGLHWEIYGFTASGQPNWYQKIEVPLTKFALEVFASGKRHIQQKVLESYRRSASDATRDTGKVKARQA